MVFSFSWFSVIVTDCWIWCQSLIIYKPSWSRASFHFYLIHNISSLISFLIQSLRSQLLVLWRQTSKFTVVFMTIWNKMEWFDHGFSLVIIFVFMFVVLLTFGRCLLWDRTQVLFKFVCLWLQRLYTILYLSDALTWNNDPIVDVLNNFLFFNEQLRLDLCLVVTHNIFELILRCNQNLNFNKFMIKLQLCLCFLNLFSVLWSDSLFIQKLKLGSDFWSFEN